MAETNGLLNRHRESISIEGSNPSPSALKKPCQCDRAFLFYNMSIKLTYFVHSSSVHNEQQIASGWSDPGLSERGIKQSLKLREEIKHREFDVIFCSDLKRAIDTANLVFKDIAPIIQDKRLKECNYGSYNGHSSTIVESLQNQHIASNFPEGESYNNVKIRISDFIEYLKNCSYSTVGIVSHQAPQLAFEVLLNNKTWEQAFSDDWRKTNAWQPGWEYLI